MSPAALTARTRALWESLAGAPAAFSPAVRVSVSPQWRARLATSRHIAQDLGFRELGSQVRIRLRP
jgi:hypothetical protein